MEKIIQAIADASKDLFDVDITPDLTRPDEQFGDYATNVALQLGKRLNKNPKKIAESIAAKLKHLQGVSDASVAGPGFINILLGDESLWGLAEREPGSSLKGKEILVEFGDPNPFKAMHLGHLYTAVVGDAIARLFEQMGATVRRLSYHGDVGMHVAKCIWAVGENIGWDEAKLASLKLDDSTISKFYTQGSKAFAEEEKFAEAIKSVNESVYKRDKEIVNKIYDIIKKESFLAFDEVFDKLGVKYQKRYLESQSAEIGLKFVKENVGKVFEISDGATVYKGEKAGLHTRVFINSRGLPTYEAKDLGLAELKKQDFPDATRSIIITANEQAEYFKVMLAALNEIDSETAQKTTHITHGFLSLTSGKMSSRKGNFFAANDLLQLVDQTVAKQYPDADLIITKTDIAAVKYTFLKHRIGADIVFDIEDSVSLEGNSGPYLQYAHARAQSILAKKPSAKSAKEDLQAGERSLLRKISEYQEVVDKAVQELLPHYICTYLYELAQTFNRFYEGNRVIDDPREDIRLKLVKSYANTLKNGLKLLNIHAPDKM